MQAVYSLEKQRTRFVMDHNSNALRKRYRCLIIYIITRTGHDINHRCQPTQTVRKAKNTTPEIPTLPFIHEAVTYRLYEVSKQKKMNRKLVF